MELDLDSLICTNTRVEKKGERGHRPLFPLSTVKETEEEEDIVVQHLRSSVWGVFCCCSGSCVLSVPFLWIPACVRSLYACSTLFNTHSVSRYVWKEKC